MSSQREIGQMQGCARPGWRAIHRLKAGAIGATPAGGGQAAAGGRLAAAW